MTKQFGPVLFATCICLVSIAAGCSSKKEALQIPDVTDIAFEVEIVPEVPEGPLCQRSSQCTPGFCDKLKGWCVECYVREHCPVGAICVEGKCAEETPCDDQTPQDCGDLFCNPDSEACVECLEDSQCPTGKWCWNQVCRKAPESCAETGQCDQMTSTCMVEKGLCLDCEEDEHCAYFETCVENACLPQTCQPGDSECSDDSTARICRADGAGYYYLSCPDGNECIQGSCVDPHCIEGDYTCVNFAKSICVFDSLKGEFTYQTAPCPPGEVCIDTDCRPLRHRVLFIFDTSGSMAWLPNTEELLKQCDIGVQPTPENPCIGLYPDCEPKTTPFTKMGISKKVFGNLLQTDQAASAFCALMRFPQVPTSGIVGCDGGFWEGRTWLTGHETAQENEVPEGEDNWFDKNLGEVLLQSFPPDHKSYIPWNTVQWFNFVEDFEDSGEVCSQHTDCGSNGWCMGTVQKSCTVLTDPEVMAHGWTPLGRTLFYAGEYMRRHVIVDGKECEKSSDCQSAGYLCNPSGHCYDPLYNPDPAKTCRQNVIVLFTDGKETEDTAQTFFNPVVQAKRFHYGLGCVADTDCLNQATCEDGLCWHPSMFQESVPEVEYVHPDELQTLKDRNGNPISLTIHVVDASGPEDYNEQIALHGGGKYYPVSVEDEVDFLQKLTLTLDIKTLAQNCIVSDQDTGEDSN